MKFVMLRAKIKETEVEFNGQVAKNDDYYEDADTSSDLYTVLCKELLRYYNEVEIWYQKDKNHKEEGFLHNSGLIERYWSKGYDNVSKDHEPDILFVRGDMVDYYPLLDKFPNAFKVYYSAGHYYLPPQRFKWDLVFVDDPRHKKEIRDAPVELFKKSCVDKYFPGGNGKGTVDIYFTCNAPQWQRKGLRFFLRMMRELKGAKALCVGLRDENLEKEFAKLPVYFTGFIPRVHVGQMMARSKLGLVLSDETDGSPRVIQEYLCSNLPVVVRKETTHSPFYINSHTGIAANDNKMVKAIKTILEGKGRFEPRNWFMKNLTMEKSAQHIVSCIEKHQQKGEE